MTQMPIGLPPHIYQQTKQFLLDSDYCQSDEALRNLLVVAPLAQWQDELPTGHSSMRRAEAVIALLAHRQTAVSPQTPSQPVLPVLCQHITDQLPKNDARYHQGQTLLTALQTVDWNRIRPPLTPLCHAYLNQLFERVNELSLAGIDPKADEARLQLTAVYTALRLNERVEFIEEDGTLWKMITRPLTKTPSGMSAVEGLNEAPHLVLLGDPGSGKSTFVDFVTLCMAGEMLGKREANLAILTQPLTDADRQQPWCWGALLPVRVLLRDFVVRGLPTDPQQKGQAKHLWSYIEGQCTDVALEPFADELCQTWLKDGGLLLLDGLDEVPNANQRRTQLKQAIEAFITVYPQVRVLVTSRTYAYQRQDWKLKGFRDYTLGSFEEAQMMRFVEGWYAHVAPRRGWSRTDAQSRAQLLQEQLQRNTNLYELAQRPLLLTLIASLHAWRGGSLPENREELYADAVELLFHWWERPKLVTGVDGQPTARQGLLDWLDAERKPVRDLLNRLAFEAQEGGVLEGTADIPEEPLVMGLFRLTRNKMVKLEQLLDYLRDRAGLLLPRGHGIYTLPHRTFQEYLAACYLCDDEAFPDTLATLAKADPNRWREVVLLAAAKVGRGGRALPWLLAEELYPEDRPEEEAELWGVHLAGQALVETGAYQSVAKRNKRKLARVKRGLIEVMRSELPATERALAGRTLAVLGDPRPEVMTIEGMQFCYVPSGLFWMGSDANDPLANDSEKPMHQVNIPYDYWLGRFPVTNSQFNLFVEVDGYEQERYWEEAKALGYWEQGKGFRGRYDKEWRKRPLSLPHSLNLPNHPIVKVSWYESLAFCRWLSDQLLEGWQAKLPTGAEWEKAARGGLQIPTHAVVCTLGQIQNMNGRPELISNQQSTRHYVWGNQPPEEGHLNYDKTIQTTNTLGCFPDDVSVYGCLDMSGNINEWIQNKSGYEYPYQSDGREVIDASDKIRVWRGGASIDERKSVRCSFSHWYDPFGRSYYLGLRVAIHPNPM